jgi:hypothetical protein
MKNLDINNNNKSNKNNKNECKRETVWSVGEGGSPQKGRGEGECNGE